MRHLFTKISLTLLLLLYGAMQGLTQRPFVCNGDFYNVFATEGLFGSSNSVFTRVTIGNDGMVNFNEISQLPEQINGFGYRVTDNLIYGITQTDDGAGINSLVRIDANGQITVLRQLTEISPFAYFAGDVTPDGNFLVVTGSSNFQPNANFVFIDLRDPTYPTQEFSFNNEVYFFPDIAFDPFEDAIAYGYDTQTRQLLQIDPQAGTTTPVGNAGQAALAITSMYFDPFGNLFGYGTREVKVGGLFNMAIEDRFSLFAIDKRTGATRALADGPITNRNDGCSCPYQLKIQHDIQPRLSVTCTELRVSYRIANATGQTRTDLDLLDPFPAGFSVVEVVSNPFGGTEIIDGGELRIEGMTIPVGVDSIVIIMTSDLSGAGVHRFQSSISGLSAALGGTVISDDPSTFNIDLDATQIEVRALSAEYSEGGDKLCPNDTLVYVFDTIAGATYTVNGVPFDGIYRITESGDYTFAASSGCTSLENGLTVIDVPVPEIELPLGQELELGDSLQVIPFNIVGEDPLQYDWFAVFGDPNISCPDCTEPFLRPLVTTLYQLNFSDANGCVVSDTILLRVDSELYYYAPNAFTPDGDDNNDQFTLYSDRPYLLKMFAVFDRWGNILYREADVRLENLIGWDGRRQGQTMNPGVYMWMAIFDLPDGSEVSAAGDINLIR